MNVTDSLGTKTWRVTLSQRRHARLATSGCAVCAEHLIANAVVNGLLAPQSMGLSLTRI